MRLVTQKDGDLSTYFEIIDENEDEINSSSLKKILTDNHAEVNRDLRGGHLPLEHISGFAQSFKKKQNDYDLNWLYENQIGNKIFYTQH